MTSELHPVELIGRKAEIAELRSLIAKSRVVLVFGSAGVGKTALVRAALGSEGVHVSLEAVSEPREAVDRTARAIARAGAKTTGEEGSPSRPPPPPPRSTGDPRALLDLLATETRTIIWDDLDVRSRKLGPLVAKFAEAPGPARVVLVSRRYFTAKEATFRAPVFEVKPLPHEAAAALVLEIERARGRTLVDDLVDATGGNPLLLRLALAETIRVAGDATSALRRIVEERSKGVAGAVVALLAAAEVPLDEMEVVRVVGKGARDAIDELRKHLVVVREGTRITIAPTAASIVRDAIPEANAPTWTMLARVAEAMLAGSPHDGLALVAAARAHLELGRPAAVLEVLHHHPIARARADGTALERLLRDLASHSAGHRAEALRVLVREQLRSADYEAARRTLDDLPKPTTYEEAERTALLRAECHVRAGEPEAGQRALDALTRFEGKRTKKGAPSPALGLTQAQLAILRGELAEARAILEALAAKTVGTATLEARRTVQISASYLYEERYEKTHEWVTRARAALKAASFPIEPVVTILDVHSLLGLGMVERAEEVIARESRGRPHAPMLHVAALVRRGELLGAIDVGDGALASLDRRADLLFRSVVARDLMRAYMGLGDFQKASRMLRIAEVGADEPGLAALGPICDAEHARLAEWKGDRARARRLSERAFAKIPGSPFVTIDRDVLQGRIPIAPADAPPAVRAYAALRAAEAGLLRATPRALDDAVTAAEAASRWYSEAALHHETARAELALAECHARRERHDLAARALDACEAIAEPRSYVPLLVGAAVVRASMAEASGDLAQCAQSLTRAIELAGDSTDGLLARAARRVGVLLRDPTHADATAQGPYGARVERLGLVRPADVIWRIGTRRWLRGKGDPPPEKVACSVELDERRVRAEDGRTLELPEQRVALLCALAEAGDDGATLEELFARVWRGTFHPLRHRNAVYVALARLKDSLKPFAREIAIAHEGERYHLAGSAPVGLRSKADRQNLASLVNGSSREDPVSR